MERVNREQILGREITMVWHNVSGESTDNTKTVGKCNIRRLTVKYCTRARRVHGYNA